MPRTLVKRCTLLSPADAQTQEPSKLARLPISPTITVCWLSNLHHCLWFLGVRHDQSFPSSHLCSCLNALKHEHNTMNISMTAKITQHYFTWTIYNKYISLLPWCAPGAFILLFPPLSFRKPQQQNHKPKFSCQPSSPNITPLEIPILSLRHPSLELQERYSSCALTAPSHTLISRDSHVQE